MGKINRRLPVKLITGLIFNDTSAALKAKAALRRSFGKIDYESPVLDFRHTDYYREEFGRCLKRQFLSFRKLINPARLDRIKILTNKIEGRLLRDKKRLVNIDPGYLDQARLILATTKDYSHRIYLNRGVYAEVTLIYRDKDKAFAPYSWTYPDYRSREYAGIFKQIRDIYLCAIHA